MTLRALLKDPNTTTIWSPSASNEFGRLMDGNKYGVVGTQAMEMIKPSDISNNRTITYASMVCGYRPLKQEAHHCRLVVGGDKLPYASNSAAPAANLIESKILFNSVISTKGAKFMTIDIRNFFLSSHMQHPEYMKIHQDDILQDILDQYKADQFMDCKGYVYFKITKGMYGLKQAAILAYQQLKENRTKHGYYPIPTQWGC